MGVPRSAISAEPDDAHVARVDPMGSHRAEINEAIRRREQAIQVAAGAAQQARIAAREAAVRKQQAAAAERRIFNQVAAVGGLRHAR